MKSDKTEPDALLQSENRILIAATELLQADFEAVAAPALIPDGLEKSAILEAIADQVKALLEKDFERLMAALYQIDLPEEQAKEALREKDQAASAQVLAHFILNRELEKAKSRQERQGLY